MYHVYYLPNAVREWLPGIKGKVGYSSVSPKLRKTWNKKAKLDVTDHRVLVDNIPTLEEAQRLEYRYQQILRCVDGHRNKHKAERRRITMLDKPYRHTEETLEKIRQKSLLHTHTPETIAKLKEIAQNRERLTCVHCGKECTPAMHKRWHGDNCPHKQ